MKSEAELRAEIAAIKKTLTSLIVWMAQSANSPISRAEAEQLLHLLDGL